MRQKNQQHSPWATLRKAGGVFVLLVLVGSSGTIRKPNDQSVEKILSFTNFIVKPGDLVFRRVDTIPNSLLASFDDQTLYSHVGVVWKSEEDAFVIHAAPGENGAKKFVEMDSFSEFLKPAYRYAVFRLRDDVDNYGVQAADIAHSLIGKITFDNKFDLSTDEAQYCTEFIWKIYSKVGLDLVDGEFGNANVFFLETDQFVFISTLLNSKLIQQIYP